ncbi:unnamed protein product [Nesidiocoris tenuis]|uniref:Uncharacterized protein n=1 Tax=Nesidiocoris tenuis TaxID=355587 RepID=A0A6H5HPL3_9HEMI|nr:unnamed protein product [Nesidiocoris tenuis]
MNGNLPKTLGRGALLPKMPPQNLTEVIRGRGVLPSYSANSPSGSGFSGLSAQNEARRTRDPIEIEDTMKQAFECEQNVYEDGPGSRLPRSFQIPGKGRKLIIDGQNRLKICNDTPEVVTASTHKPVDSNSLAEPKFVAKNSTEMNGDVEKFFRTVESAKLEESKKTARTVPVPYEVRTGFYRTKKGPIVTDDTEQFEREVFIREAAIVDVQQHSSVEVPDNIVDVPAKKVPAEPPIPQGTFTKVTVLHREDADFLWVVTAPGLKRLLEINQILEEHCEEQARRGQVEKHRVYAAIFSNIW